MAHTIVIFGASGDLTRRKLIPALFQLYRKGRLPQDTRIVGCSRTAHQHQSWQAALHDSTAEFVGEAFDEDAWRGFQKAIYYQPLDIHRVEDFQILSALLDEIEQQADSTRIYYLSLAPQFYEAAITHLGEAGLAAESSGPRRIVIEKPFGTDGESARELNDHLHGYFQEDQIYRIDHYLGKETVQNLFVLRFANSIFEPVWNRNYIENVQITVAEEVTVGSRGGYYDHSGVLRDMFQNHLLQLMTLIAMEAPVRYQAELVRDEKKKVLEAVRAMSAEDICQNSVRGFYRGYRQEAGVAADSSTATFAAIRLWVDNWRWQGVPFYLRSGKAMSCRTTQIVIQFRRPPHMLFSSDQQRTLQGNRLIIQIQPAEGIELEFQSKVPDAGMRLRTADLDFRFSQEFSETMPEAYERLLLDALEGDASLFSRADEVELAWAIIDPILAAWQAHDCPELLEYEPGLWGPEQSTQWMHAQGHSWFDACPVLR